MKQPIFLTVFMLLHSIIIAQIKHDSLPHYVTLKEYKEKYSKPLSKKDSLNFTFKDNDTLVLLGYHSKPKGVLVPYEYKDSTFLYYYKKVVFNHTNDSLSKHTSMKYWKDDIRIFFSESVSRKTRKNFMSFAKNTANSIDSLHVSEVKKLEDSNYVIYYLGDYEYEARIANNKYSDSYFWWKHNKIHRYSMKIDTEEYFSEDLIQFKMREYFIQSLGYFYLSNDFDCGSYFANCYSPNKKLTPLDLELLKYHYSYGICKGTSLEIFEEQHKKAKEILEATGQYMYFVHDTEVID